MGSRWEDGEGESSGLEACGRDAVLMLLNISVQEFLYVFVRNKSPKAYCYCIENKFNHKIRAELESWPFFMDHYYNKYNLGNLASEDQQVLYSSTF